MVATRVLRWLVFTVLVAVLPLVFFWLSAVHRGGQVRLSEVAGTGEIYLVAATICAGAAGELIARPTRRRTAGALAGGAAVLVAVLAAMLFADTRTRANGAHAPPHTDAAAVTTVSAWVLALAIVSAGFCIGLGDE